MVEGNERTIAKVYAVKTSSWGDAFIAFDSYEGAECCFKSLTKNDADAKACDYIVKLPVFSGCWEVESYG